MGKDEVDGDVEQPRRRNVLKGLSVGSLGLAAAGTAKATAPGPSAAVPSDAKTREEAGLEIISKLGWGTNEGVREIDEDLWRLVSETNFGAIWTRPGLTLREREMITIAVLVAVGAQGVALHFKHASKVGLSDDAVKEIILQTAPYAGLPKALSAMASLRRIQKGGDAKL